MRKSLFEACFAILVLCITACQGKEQIDETHDVAEPCQITCTMSADMPEFKVGGDPETKSSLESVVRVRWNKDDELSVINLTTGKQLGGCIKADKDGSSTTFSPSGLNGSITAGDKLVFLLDNEPSRRSASEKDFEPFTMDYSSQKGNANEVPIVVYADYTATANGTIEAINPEFHFLMSYVQLAVSALPASTSVTELGIENLNTRCQFSISNHEFVKTPQNGNITLSQAFTANSKGTNTRYFSCFTSPSQDVARNAHINANGLSHITAWLKAALSAGYYYQSVATGFTNENISFVDDAFKSYCVSHYDRNGDGELSFAEAAAVTSFESFTAAEKSSIKEVFELPYFFKGEQIPTFEGCTALKQIILPGSLQTIQANAFKGCTGLEVITIPSTVSAIGEGAFERCTSLARFDGAYASTDRRYIIRDNHVLAFAPAGLTETTIPAGVTHINAGVFANNTALKTVNLSAELTTVEARAFKGCTALPIIRFRTQIASIGAEAFKGCSALRSVYSDAVTPPSVGTDAFANCHASLAAHVTSGNLAAYEAVPAWSALSVSSGQPWNEIWYTTTDGNKCNTDIKSFAANTYIDGKGILLFNADVTTLKDYAFWSGRVTPNLATISLPACVLSIGDWAFDGQTSLSSIVIPEGLQSIGYSAFGSCGLTTVTIPSSVTNLGNRAFAGCQSLNSLNVQAAVQSIGEWSFSGCTSLSSVTLSNSILSIELGAFEGCSSLTSIILPEGLESIGNQVFYNCSILPSIIIPDSVESIGWHAFGNCYALSSITIPDSISSIGGSVFDRCNALHTVYAEPSVLAGISLSLDRSYTLYTKDQTPQLVTEVIIPDTIVNVSRSFCHCTSISSITIPSAVQSISNNAFSSCSALSSITISEGLKSIGSGAFSYCSSLTTITLPATIESVGIDCFSSCPNLSTVFIKAIIPPSCDYSEYDGSFPSVRTIYVPTASVDAYINAWPDYADKILGYDFE